MREVVPQDNRCSHGSRVGNGIHRTIADVGPKTDSQHAAAAGRGNSLSCNFRRVRTAQEIGVMMQLGFVSAILPDQSLEEVAAFAAAEAFECAELMCWPPGKAERRYAGVTHVDVVDFDERSAERVRKIMDSAGVAISALGYYPNPLVADHEEAGIYIKHLGRLIRAAQMLNVNTGLKLLLNVKKLTLE